MAQQRCLVGLAQQRCLVGLAQQQCLVGLPLNRDASNTRGRKRVVMPFLAEPGMIGERASAGSGIGETRECTPITGQGKRDFTRRCRSFCFAAWPVQQLQYPKVLRQRRPPTVYRVQTSTFRPLGRWKYWIDKDDHWSWHRKRRRPRVPGRHVECHLLSGHRDIRCRPMIRDGGELREGFYEKACSLSECRTPARDAA